MTLPSHTLSAITPGASVAETVFLPQVEAKSWIL